MAELRDHENGYLYIVVSVNKQDEPVRIKHWYPLGMQAAEFKRSYGGRKIGQPLTSVGPGMYMDQEGLRYTLPQGGETMPDFSEEVEIPPPRQRGRQLPVEYRWGCWWKKTKKRGWIKA